jgi:uncharacterized protein involved in exopolysaccharide biosynthesis
VTPTTPPTKKTMWFGGGALAGLLLCGLGALAMRRRRTI